MKNLRDLLPQEIEELLISMGEPKYRAKQVFKWLGRGIGSIDEMTDVPKALREKLKTEYTLYKPAVLSKQVSKIDGTIKYLWELSDGNAVETVVMSYKHGNTSAYPRRSAAVRAAPSARPPSADSCDALSRTRYLRRSCSPR